MQYFNISIKSMTKKVHKWDSFGFINVHSITFIQKMKTESIQHSMQQLLQKKKITYHPHKI